MATEIPEKIRSLLNNVVNGKIDNYDVEIEEGKMKGENFLGDIAFVSLKGKRSNDIINVIVKQAFEDMHELQFFGTVYATEIKFYEKIWPVLNKFQEEHSIGFNKIPKCYTTCDTPGSEKIVLEDLRPQRFQLYEKTMPVDRKHYEYIFKTYGVYHAISYAFRELHPEEFSKLADMLKRPESQRNSDHGKKFGMLLQRTMIYIRDLFSEDDDIYKVLDENINNFSKLFTPYSGDSPVILHGDCWSNNFLFKYDANGNITDMRFLDFQMVNTSSPVNDLTYCLYSGASKDILDNLDDLLEIYINSFSETLERFNVKPEKSYTMNTIKSEWKRYGKLGLIVGAMLWRIKLVDKNFIPNVTDGSLTTLFPVAEEYVDVFNKRLKDLATHYYEKGLF